MIVNKDTRCINDVQNNQIVHFYSDMLQILSEHTIDIISIWNKQSELIFSTLALESGIMNEMPASLDELINYIHWDDCDLWKQRIEESMLSGKNSTLIHRLLKENQIYFVKTQFHCILDMSGKLDYLVIAIRNITDYIHLQKKMKENEQIYHLLFNSSPDGIFVLNLAGEFTQCNEECSTITGYSVNELNNMHFSQIVNQSDFRNFIKARRKFPLSVDMGIEHKDGVVNLVRIKILPIIVEKQIRGYFGIARDITLAKITEQKFTSLAYIDHLTNIPNRSFFDEMVSQKITKREPFTLFIVNINRLKSINDNLGPNYGDVLLIEFSCKLKSILRTDDILARLTGNEFGILLKGTHKQSIIKKFMRNVFSLLDKPFIIGKQEISLQTCVGISRFPEDGSDREEILKKAGIAITTAKEEVGNSYKIYSNTMGQQIFERFSLEKDLRKAFERRELEVYYQPLVSVSSQNVIGLEALLRWNHPIKGYIPPVEFIPVAEDSGLMESISEWVLKKASLDIFQLNNHHLTDLFVTVNISAPHFRKPQFISTVKKILKDVNINERNIKLEITESLLMKDIEHTIRILLELQKMGIEVYIDDFGTGYSSLSYLKSLPIAGLKIDKSFVTNSLLLEKDKAIVKAIINLAQILDLKVTAEGVETKEQLKLLQMYQCDYFQGFLFSKPEQLGKIGRFITKSFCP
ncbi:sensor domain-containing protein [Paenibacillus silviterrae]|uniref:sensor domain-containing protein n=1 Tax=Paenibacillus silviterrae TaxID=3242194 RepID=UPI002543A468|nr:GGDEF domain-containing phosphodiesterase [Paenibacillus chinjuensis]